jgi:hypothetical protein
MSKAEMMRSLLQQLQDTSLATAIREGAALFPWIESVHVLALTLVVGSIAIVDLRLIGLTWRERGVSDIAAQVLPITWFSFAVAVISGGLLFSSNATVYAANRFFQVKMVLLLLAGLNMAIYHVFSRNMVQQWETTALTPMRARIAGGLSLSFWVAVIAAGRWIGFTLNELT